MLTLGISMAFSAREASADSLLVGGYGAGFIRQYDSATGAYLGVFASGGGLTYPTALAWGPDGNLYVGDYSSGTVLRYSGRSGAFLGVVASVAPSNLIDIAFGQSTNLFVGLNNGSVHRFNALTGASLGQFIPPYDGGLGGLVSSGSSVYVTLPGYSEIGGQLRKHSAATGEIESLLYSSFSSNGPRSPRFGPDNNLYVPDWQTPRVAKFQFPSFDFVGNIIDDNVHRWPKALEFSTDGGIFVLEDDGMASSINRYTLATGAFERQLVAPGSGGLGRANCLLRMGDLPKLLITDAWLDGAIQTVQLAWTNNGTACVLETASEVTGSWISFNPPASTNGNMISTSLLSQDNMRFYRLRRK